MGQAGKVEVNCKKEVILEAQKKQRTSHFATQMDACQKKTELRAEVSKIQRPSCAPRRHCERRFRILCCIDRARLICVTNYSRKKVMDIISGLPGCAGQAADAVSV